MSLDSCVLAVVVKRWIMLASMLLSYTLNAQLDTTARWAVAISPHGGFVVPHHKSVTHLIQGHSAGFHLYAKRLTNGTKYWHEAYNMPEHGVDFTFTNTGNPTQLGQQYSTSYLLNLPLNGKRYVEDWLRIFNRGFRHWIGLGIGMGYTTRRWDLETNHQAAMLGSRLNIALSLQYSVRIASFKNGELRSGIRMSHLSNGAFQLPNLGTNNAGLLVSYVVGNNRAAYMKVIPTPDFHRSIFSVGIVSGLKEIPPPTGRKYAAVVLSALAERRISYKSAFGVGLDAFYDSSLRPLVLQRTGDSVTPSQVMQLGAVCSYSLFFDRFALKIQQGFYVIDAQRLNGSLYHRVGLRYAIGNHLYAQLTLKTHFAKADYGELGIGYVFSK
jgi:Lipid A 3-O-deacylase (PagL)